MNFKQVLFGILLVIGAAFALTVNSPEPIQIVTSGQAAAFELVLSGNGETVQLTVDSELPVSLSKTFIEVNGIETLNLIAYTKNFNTGAYGIEVSAETGGNTYTYQLSVVIKDQEASLKLDLIYDELKLIPGEDAEIRFILTNTGTQTLRNVIIKSDILRSFNPEYPKTVILTPGSEKELLIKIDVPSQSASQDYIFTITAASGEIEISKEVIVEIAEERDISNSVSLDVADGWKAVKDSDGNIIGYEISFTVENDDAIRFNNVKVEFAGLPSGWEVKGDTEFDIKSYDEKTYSVRVYPTNFDEISAKMRLVYKSQVLDSQTVSFAGYKVGAPTGFFFMGGSLAIGILLVVVIVLAVLYLRQRNMHTDDLEDLKTKTYLEDLVKKAQTEREKETKKRK